MAMNKERGLGRGIDAFFDTPFAEPKEDASSITMLKLSMVEPNPSQPRKRFDREQLQALADSIAEHGVLSPILVTEGENGYYTIVAGERRWRASKLAGLTEIPAMVRSLDDQKAAEIALIENLQREDLNPMEEALGYQRLMDTFGLTQEKVSERVGKSRSAVANTLRLIGLDDEIQELLIAGDISAGHARALLAVEDKEQRLELATRILVDGLTVRQIEYEAQQTPTKKNAPPRRKRAAREYQSVEKMLADKFGTKVRIKGSEKGKIEIEYYSAEDLTRIVDLL